MLILRCVKLGPILAICLLINISCNGQDGFIEGEPALAYWKIGSKKEIVIVLHGGPAAPHQYLRPELDRLSQFAQVIYYDQRGCGKSDQASNYHWQTHVEDLERVITTFAGKKKVYLVGSSWGTFLAILYVYKHPEKVKGLILSGTVGWEGKGLDDVQYSEYLKTHYSPRPLFINKTKIEEKRLISTKSTMKDNSASIISIEKEAEIFIGPAGGETRVSMATAPVLDSLRKITQPVLIFNGDNKDCLIDKAKLYLTVFPNAELYTIPAACHDPWFSDPEQFSAKCAQFIKKFRKVSNQ